MSSVDTYSPAIPNLLFEGVTMKKTITLLLALVTVLTCLCTTAFADSAAQITFDKPDTGNGDTVELRLTMPDTNTMKDITALGIMLSYDPNAFEFVSMDNWMSDAENGVVTANWMSSNAIRGDDIRGKTYTVTFRCITDTAAAYDFAVAFDSGNCFNAALEKMTIPSASGSISVSAQPAQSSDDTGNTAPSASADADDTAVADPESAAADDTAASRSLRNIVSAIFGSNDPAAATSADDAGSVHVGIVAAALLAVIVLVGVIIAVRRKRRP